MIDKFTISIIRTNAELHCHQLDDEPDHEFKARWEECQNQDFFMARLEDVSPRKVMRMHSRYFERGVSSEEKLAFMELQTAITNAILLYVSEDLPDGLIPAH